MIIDRLAVAESTGQLVPGLSSIARTYQDGLARQVALFIRLVSTGVLLCAFAFLAYAIVSAVFRISISFSF